MLAGIIGSLVTQPAIPGWDASLNKPSFNPLKVMREFVKPKIIISKCLTGAYCRYNGEIIFDKFINQLIEYIEFNPVCPEVEIRLGVPRDPIRVVSQRGKVSLKQPATGRDITKEMTRFIESFLNSIKKVDGFLLKARSPSCGIEEVNIYPTIDAELPIEKGAGFFGQAVLTKFPTLPIEDEERLTDLTIRERFLMKLHLVSTFREREKE
jgi:uncharacterized protein YbbK (DUF523 family)